MPQKLKLPVRTKRFLNWRAYFQGMYARCIQAATGAFLAYCGSNTAEGVAPEWLHNVGLSWKQGLVIAVAVLLFEVIRYVNAKPMPDEVSTSPFGRRYCPSCGRPA